MDPIPVPAPPASAFNKNRKVSDLLLGQLRHFQHVEHKQGIKLDAALARDIHTEAGAARYIASITRAVRGAAVDAPAVAAPTPIAQVPSTRPARTRPSAQPTKPIREEDTLDLAAVSDPPLGLGATVENISARDRIKNESKSKSKKQHKGKLT